MSTPISETKEIRRTCKYQSVIEDAENALMLFKRAYAKLCVFHKFSGNCYSGGDGLAYGAELEYKTAEIAILKIISISIQAKSAETMASINERTKKVERITICEIKDRAEQKLKSFKLTKDQLNQIKTSFESAKDYSPDAIAEVMDVIKTVYNEIVDSNEGLTYTEFIGTLASAGIVRRV